jgi:hypothetical protein
MESAIIYANEIRLPILQEYWKIIEENKKPPAEEQNNYR